MTETAPRPLAFGEPFKHLHLPSNRNPRFAVGSLGGRFTLLFFVYNVKSDTAAKALDAFATAAARTPEGARLFALVCADPNGADDARVKRIAEKTLVFYDGDRSACREWGAPQKGDGLFVMIDPTVRVLGLWAADQYERALAALAAAPDPGAHAGTPLHAPILIVPRIFEPAFCKALIEHYESRGGEASGTTRENEEGRTYVALDDAFKRRSDCDIDDQKLRDACMHRIFWRLLPEIERAFAYRATRMERYIVACYEAESGGFFKAHRDNTTKGTAHRRFAVTINLNAEEYEGGDLRVPEYGSRTYRAPTGGAVVFSCSLLHEATPVTRGRRYAFLPFLYDDEAASVRAQNSSYLDESIRPYRDRPRSAEAIDSRQ
jgi:predicted 2-oxoglutarate/Fe(II)-dependent dioxygenase YbiX